MEKMDKTIIINKRLSGELDFKQFVLASVESASTRYGEGYTKTMAVLDKAYQEDLEDAELSLNSLLEKTEEEKEAYGISLLEEYREDSIALRIDASKYRDRMADLTLLLGEVRQWRDRNRGDEITLEAADTIQVSIREDLRSTLDLRMAAESEIAALEVKLAVSEQNKFFMFDMKVTALKERIKECESNLEYHKDRLSKSDPNTTLNHIEKTL